LQAIQLGVALGVAILASISTSVTNKRVKQGHSSGSSDYHGAAAAYWFVVAFIAFLGVMISVFYRVEDRYRTQSKDPEAVGAQSTTMVSESDLEETRTAVATSDEDVKAG
jgi:Ni/Fe-hydrogenase subunit HybB-like protein